MKAGHQTSRLAVDYRTRVVYAVRDCERKNTPVVFHVVVYGLHTTDFWLSELPAIRAIERMGLDPNRYQAIRFDGPVCDATFDPRRPLPAAEDA